MTLLAVPELVWSFNTCKPEDNDLDMGGGGGGGGGGEKRTLTGCFYGLVPEQEGEGGGGPFWVSGDPSCCPGACVVFQHMQAGGQRFGYGGGGGGGERREHSQAVSMASYLNKRVKGGGLFG